MNSRSDWQYTSIADVCEAIIDCVNRTAPIVDQPTPYKMIRTSNIKHGWIDVQNVRYVLEDVYRRWSRRGELREGDVILTREAPLGEVGMIRKSDTVFMGQRLIMYRADPSKLDPLFLLYAMQEDYLRGQIRAFSSGSTVEHMRVPDAKTLSIFLPPINLQHKIGRILSAYDDLIENNAQRIQILDQITYALYQEWFVRFCFPALGDKLDTDLQQNQIPNGWFLSPLRDICSYINRGISPKYDDTSECLVINQKCIRNGRLNLQLSRKNSKTVSQEKYVQYGDILVNSTGEGTLGRVAQVYQEVTNCTVDSHVSIVRPIDPALIDYLGITLIEKQNYLSTLGEGATNQTELTRSRLGNVEIIVPPRELLMQFSEIVSPLRTQANILAKKNTYLSETRDLLLPRLISGELDVSQLDNQVEELEVLET